MTHKRENPLSTPPPTDTPIWMLEPGLVFLNHGSFGSCPRPVLEFQREIRARIEHQPIHFFVRDLENLLDEARAKLAEFVGADPDDLAFVPNATAGINTVLRSLRFEPGDELLVTDHEYNACRNALEFVAGRWQARVVVAKVPFPLRDSGQIVEEVLSCVTPRTRLALLDHVTSQTGVVFPIAKLVDELSARGVDAVIDGAHAPGMLPLNLRQLGAAYYTGNCHKWLCAPKGAGFLHVRRDRQGAIRPLSISHGANSTRTDRSRFLIEFAWTGTSDPSAALSVPEALRFISSLVPGGWPALMQRNHELVLTGRKLLCAALGVEVPCPDELIGSLASVPIPDGTGEQTAPSSPLYSDPLQGRLRAEFGIEVPIIPWPAPPKRLLRISAQLYNSTNDYERLAQALQSTLG
jgi:isopenicillin-N epimerase